MNRLLIFFLKDEYIFCFSFFFKLIFIFVFFL